MHAQRKQPDRQSERQRDQQRRRDAERQRPPARPQAIERDRDAIDLARQRYGAGVASFIDVLDAQRTLQQNQLLLVDAQAAVSIDLVVLYKALGGGWE